VISLRIKTGSQRGHKQLILVRLGVAKVSLIRFDEQMSGTHLPGQRGTYTHLYNQLISWIALVARYLEATKASFPKETILIGSQRAGDLGKRAAA